jgi:hypothetical protein
MSVYYYNGAQILAPFTITSNEPMFDADTVSLKKQRATQNAQRWEISFSTVGTPDTVQDMLIAAVSQNQLTSTMIMPQLPAVSDKFTLENTNALPTTTVSIHVSASVGDSSIDVKTLNRSGTLPKGCFFKFSSHDKLYMTTSDTVFDGTNNPTINFYPSLRSNATTAHQVRLGDAARLTYYKSVDNMSGITFTDGVLSNSGTIELLEAL